VAGVPGDTFVTLATALDRTIAQGSLINNFFQADDTDSQRLLARAELDANGNPTDGIHEYTIVDGSLKALFQLYMRAYAELELFSKPIITVKYATRDPKSRSGQTVHVDLTNPPCKGDFLIQEVTIDQIHDESDVLTPRYTVSASSVKFELNDLLLRILGASTTGGSSGAGVVASALTIVSSTQVQQLKVTITDAQLRLPAQPTLILPAIPGLLYCILDLQAVMNVLADGGVTITNGVLRYTAPSLRQIVSTQTIYTSGILGRRFIRQTFNIWDIQSTENLIGLGVEFVTTGNPGAGFRSESGFQFNLTYTTLTIP
jgi:hypothetical protein